MPIMLFVAAQVPVIRSKSSAPNAKTLEDRMTATSQGVRQPQNHIASRYFSNVSRFGRFNQPTEKGHQDAYQFVRDRPWTGSSNSLEASDVFRNECQVGHGMGTCDLDADSLGRGVACRSREEPDRLVFREERQRRDLFPRQAAEVLAAQT